ncbi:MAG: hypothetical protein AB9866_19865 [Syntrophobacteraceae bacterium]
MENQVYRSGIIGLQAGIPFREKSCPTAPQTGIDLQRETSDPLQIEDLVDMEDPEAVFFETCIIARLIHPEIDLRFFQTAFKNTLRLFRGEYSGYRKCNILYHDLKHTTDCLLAIARLLHGASLRGRVVTPGNLILGLIAALFHDSGYIQRNDEISGTGAKFTLGHIDRSIAFLEKYARLHIYLETDLPALRNFLRCTGLDVEVKNIAFGSGEHELIGKALGTADLLGQMADRTYLERLPLLFHEFCEGGVPGFKDEIDLIKKTPGFWEFTKTRFEVDLGGLDLYMKNHFQARWGINCDLYRQAIEENIGYLKRLMENHEKNYRNYLRRGGILARNGHRRQS